MASPTAGPGPLKMMIVDDSNIIRRRIERSQQIERLEVVACAANGREAVAMFERTREIGTMLAMGTPRRWIVALFMVEATLTGILGAIVGVVGGNLLGMALNASGLHLPPPPGTSFDMMFKVLHVPGLMVGSSVLVVVSLALASILPAIRASRLQIAEALAHV